MADPTMETFCCHLENGTEMAKTVMKDLNTEAYNGVCLFSSALGVLGAVYQILPRQELSSKHQWLSFSAERGRNIIIWLAIADLLACLGVLARSTAWIRFKNIMPALDDDSSVLFCSISSAIIQYFFTATWIWTLIYAIDMRLILREQPPRTKYYHLMAWTLPALLTTLGLSLLYLPDANCHSTMSLHSAVRKILPNYLITYAPIALVMIANPILYRNSSKDMERIITSAAGQFTSKEREILAAVKIKFGAINAVYYLCWLPNILNGVLLWILWFELPVYWVISVWYMMAMMNPLQALLNCLVYRRWSLGSERIILPWRKVPGSSPGPRTPDYGSTSTVREEMFPLLHHSQSVNGYRSYQ